MFYIGIVLIVLALVLLAMRGAFGDFPAQWEWVGIVFAGVGILMASPMVLQMIWGRPRLSVEFENDAHGEERLLIVFLKNLPIGTLVKALGVKRDTIQSLTASLQVAEVGSGRIIIPVLQLRIYSDDDETDNGRGRTVLPPTYLVGANLVVAKWDAKARRVIVPPTRTHPETPLPEGYYEARILFLVDGEKTQYNRRFKVGQAADELDWCPGSTSGT